MKLRLYLDSSVLGAEFDTESEYRVETSRHFFEWIEKRGHVACISAVTLSELKRAPVRIQSRIEELLDNLELELLVRSNEADSLAEEYLAVRVVPPGSVAHAQHLAIASIHGVDAVVSWNFRHMVNLLCRRRARSVNVRFGVGPIEIVSPSEALESEELDDE